MTIDYSELGAPETRSFWLNTYGPYEANEKLNGHINADIVIVGGGFTGLSTAAHLKKINPSIDVVVIEGSVIGYGASGRNGGFSMTLFGFEPEVTSLMHGNEKAAAAHQYMEDAVDYVKELVELSGFNSNYEHNGFARVSLTKKHSERLKKQYELYCKLGFEKSFEWWDSGKLQEELKSPVFKVGFYEKRCGILNPAKQVREWKKLCENLGVKIYENTIINSVEYPNTGVVVKTSQGSVKAEKVVLATNAYGHLIPEMGAFNRNQTPIWTYQIVTEPLSQSMWDSIGWQGRYGIETNRHMVHYFRPTADGRITFGGANVETSIGNNMNYDSNDSYWRTLEYHLKTMFPQLKNTRIDYRWGGPVSVTLDMTPNLGFYKDERTLYLCGCTGHGVSFTQYSGKTLAELALGIESKRTNAWFVNRKPFRWPVQPLKQIGIATVKNVLKAEDAWQERSLWK